MKEECYSLTNPQRSIYLTEEYYKGSNINNVGGTITIKQPIECEKLVLAIKQVIKQNDGCRIILSNDEKEVKQRIQEYNDDFNIEVIDVCSEEELFLLATEVLSKPFELYNSSLLKFVVYRFPDKTGGFVINMHHIISDSWTVGIIINEIIETYSKYIKNEDIISKDTELYSYTNYIKSEAEYKASDKYQKDKTYWEEVFATIPDNATIPSMNTNSEISVKASREQLSIPCELLNRIKEYCGAKKVSIFNFLTAIYSIYIGKVSNLEDFCIGTPILNRSNFKEKNTTGMFINTLPIRVNIEDSISFKDFLQTIVINSMSLLRHQKYSYQNIIEDLRKKQSNLPTLYQVMLSYQITKMNKDQDEIPHETIWYFNNTMADDVDIHIFDLNDTNELNIAYDYKIDKYTSQEMRNIHNRVLYMILQVLDNENINISDLEIVTPEEKEQLIYKFNETKIDYPKNKTIAELFEEQVKLTPDNIALVFENKSLTYKELNEKANSLAQYLRENNIKNNSIVGIMINRSLEMIIGILAILKAGGAYIPIDPDYPTDRIDYLLENSNCSYVLTSKNLLSKIHINCKKIDINLTNESIYNLNKQNLSHISEPNDLSYLIYTSGSTGKPKGVMLTQKALVNLANYCNNVIPYLKNREEITIVSVTTVSFDIFIFETLISLQRGLKLVIANSDEQTIPHCLNKLIEKENIQAIQTTPSRMQLFYQHIEDIPNLSNLKYITLAGEQLSVILKNNLLKLTNGKIFNGYGPSETTVFSTLTDVTNQQNITIGKPLANTQIYILDKNLKPCPIGIAGEIYISGDGVGLGYMQNPTLTQKSFISNPFLQNSIMYKTGDIGAYQANGEIICMGRIDHQVKIRGLRIELGEIENVMLQYDSISACVVVKKLSSENHEFLCAYYTSDNIINENELREILKNKLPNYMIPQYFIKLDKMPYTPNGKIDKKSLPEINLLDIQKNKKEIKPRNKIDTVLIKFLKELLKIKKISIEDSFYELGGDSLSAIQLCSILYHELNIQISVKDILKYPIIKDLSDYIESKLTKKTVIAIKATDKKEYYPASSVQKRIFYATQTDENSILYNIAGGLLLNKKPNISKLEKCLQQLINRHSSLRTYFAFKDGELVQKVVDNVNFKLEVEEKIWKEKDKIINEFIKPFDLLKPLLFRIKLVLFENEKAMLLIDIHHSISDGTSLSIFLNELSTLYNDGTLEDKQIEYKDFVVWENNYLKSQAYQEDKEYWKEQFTSELPILDMPGTMQRPSKQSFEGNSYQIKLDDEFSKKLLNVAKEQNVTPYMLLLSAYYILLYKYSGESDIIVGTPVINREDYNLRNVLGMFVNNLALRAKINSSNSLKTFLQEIKENCINSFNHQSYPFSDLINDLGLKRDISRNPIFDTMFIYQNNGYRAVKLGDISAKYYIPDSKISKMDFSLEIIPDNNNFEMRFEYCTKIFTKTYIENMVEHYKNILKYFVSNIDTSIEKVNILTKEEENKILYEFNNTYMPYNKNTTLVELFEKQVEAHSNDIAITFENNSLTYRELNEKANRLANYLVNNCKIKRNEVVGIMLNRSIETVISMLAILKSGAAYLLIDSSLPFDRILYMLENSKTNLLITNKVVKQIDFTNKILLDKIDLSYYSKNNLNMYISNDDILSIVYTSGSTGLPKGVIVRKLGMSNLILSYKNHMKIDNYKNFLSMCSISFDMFAVEIWIPFACGKRVILANEEQCKIPNYIGELITKYKIDYMLITPSKLKLLMESDPKCLSLLKSIQLGGERLSSSVYEKLSNLTNAIICNEYGPSECTSCSTYKTITKNETITIGKPFYNTQVYICNRDYNLSPIGFNGEICISGDGVTLGYVNNKDLTNKSFIDNPFGEGKLYKTGDIGAFTENGEIIYIGRKDFQVKIRGLRIELSEIEKQISLIKGITNVAVVCPENETEKFIVCYYTANETIKQNEIRSYLSQKLPNYMIPKYLIQLESLPLSSNGKIDKKALSNRKILLNQNNTEKVMPQNELQKLFCDIWTDLLKVQIGIDDDLFECGADSLLAIKFKTELLAHKINIPYANIFKYTTIRELSKVHETLEDEAKIKDDEIIKATLKKNNSRTLKNKTTCNKENKVLLLGGNGFVGSHILYEFIKNDTGKIYCIIRGKGKENAHDRFINVLHFYFGTELDKYIGKRIFMVEGNILEEDFGLSHDKFENLMKDTSIILNAAAIVKHYGNKENFKRINVDLTKNLIKISKEYNKRFIHISSTSVSGNTDNFTRFTEADLDVNQTLQNVYVESKYEAEQLILREINNGLNAQILRLGNITNRYKDGKFQINPKENSFVTKLESFIKLQMIPDNLLNTELQFTPVDVCAKAIILIIQNELKNFSIYHLINDNTITMQELVKNLKILQYPIEIVPINEFNKKVDQILQDKSKNNILFGIINDFGKDNINDNNIQVSSELTKSFLSKVDFDWPKINDSYIKKYIQYLKQINLI